MAASTVKHSVLASDQFLIEQTLQSALPPNATSVARAMRYAVLGSGQRLRPLLALRVSRVLGGRDLDSLGAASAVEFLHCASLIVDDLPCMDNETMRRNRAALHIEFGEATAVLAAFALVSLAARSVADLRRFQTKLLETLDCESLIGGQALDLELAGDHRDLQRSRLTTLKTVPLFELAIEAGLATNQSSCVQREALLSFGRHFGISYQLMDDYLDGELNDRTQVSAQVERSRGCLDLFDARGYHFEDLLDTLNAKLPEDSRSYR